MASILPIACFFFFFILATSSIAINIRDYGAVPDGSKDSTKALQNAWNTACAAESDAMIEIPMGRYLIGPVLFKGPCNSPVTIHMIGTLIAKKDLALYKPNWIEFQYINGLILYGPGKVDGQGADAWTKNKCRQNHKSFCRPFPMNMVFSFVSNANISRISSINSKYFHMLVFGSSNIIFDSITITAPGNSPNTDGIHIAVSQNIIIQNSVIGTGDDCVSIGDKTHNLTILGVRCGPGHGISIGSLGRNLNEEDVVGLTIRNCSFRDTQNGVRIKTWQDGPNKLHVRDLLFEDIRMENVENPIVIDQKYCPSRTCPDNLRPSRVKIRNVKFNNIVGTSTSQMAINLVCSASNPCEGVELNHIDLKFNGVGEAKATCVNVKAPKVIGIVKPANCA